MLSAVGPMGYTGFTGPPGRPGRPGATGATGDTGATGLPAVRGPIGSLFILASEQYSSGFHANYYYNSTSHYGCICVGLSA